MALCNLGEKWIVMIVRTQVKEKTGIIKEKDHTNL